MELNYRSALDKTSTEYYYVFEVHLQCTSRYADTETGLPTPLSATHLYSPRNDLSALVISRLFPEANVMPSLTVNQDNLGVGLPVALQLSVTLRLSSSRRVMLRGILSKTGETRSRNI